MNKTIEEIIWEHTPMNEYPTYYHESDIELMIQAYADQEKRREAIAFAEWMKDRWYPTSAMTFDQWYDLYTNPFQTPLKMITMSKCTKPNCDCLERAEKANGGPLKDGYRCLYNTDAVNAAKEKTRLPPSLPETEHAIDPAEARRNIPDDMDEWCEAHQSYYKYECPECAILAPPDQPVPEEHSGHPDIPADDMKKIEVACSTWNEEIAPWMLKGMVRGYLLAIKKLPAYVYRTEEQTDALAKIIEENTALQSRLSSTEAERDAIRQAFDLQAEELKKLRNQ